MVPQTGISTYVLTPGRNLLSPSSRYKTNACGRVLPICIYVINYKEDPPPPKKGNPSFLNLFINAISMNISQIFVLRHIFEQRLAATLSSRKSQLYPQPVHVGPVMYEKVPKQTYIPVSMLYPFNINPPMILTHSFIYQRR